MKHKVKRNPAAKVSRKQVTWADHQKAIAEIVKRMNSEK